MRCTESRITRTNRPRVSLRNTAWGRNIHLVPASFSAGRARLEPCRNLAPRQQGLQPLRHLHGTLFFATWTQALMSRLCRDPAGGTAAHQRWQPGGKARPHRHGSCWGRSRRTSACAHVQPTLLHPLLPSPACTDARLHPRHAPRRTTVHTSRSVSSQPNRTAHPRATRLRTAVRVPRSLPLSYPPSPHLLPPFHPRPPAGIESVCRDAGILLKTSPFHTPGSATTTQRADRSPNSTRTSTTARRGLLFPSRYVGLGLRAAAGPAAWDRT